MLRSAEIGKLPTNIATLKNVREIKGYQTLWDAPILKSPCFAISKFWS